MDTVQQKKDRNIQKILIANRGEVVRRIQYTCHALGIKTVVVYAPEDVQAGYVQAADYVYQLPGNGVRAYLDADALLKIAHEAAVDAIHPGYGFFSEHAEFAQRVIDAGLLWVGPSPSCMASMGDKIIARSIMQTAGVPVVPGACIPLTQVDAVSVAQQMAQKIGYPVVIKDPRGGGGRGMKKVLGADDFLPAWRHLVGNAERMTGSSDLLLEKYVTNGRHIEVQVAGDGQRQVHFFERECSVQRRHQKIIEETPCLFVDQKNLERMYEAALIAARTVGYQSVGTVEFIVTPDQQFYFLEMNTRLQVEHSVTELTTGVDLVAVQLRLAQGERLPFQQTDIVRQGHALECRIYAEDPAQHFVPASGVVTGLAMPTGPFLRCDHDLSIGTEVTPFFDPMVAKITTFACDRKLAIAYMQEALRQTVIAGVTTNIRFLQAILASRSFATGQIDTQWLTDEQVIAGLLEASCPEPAQENMTPDVVGVLAAFLLEKLRPDDLPKPAGQERETGGVGNRWKVQAWK